MKHSITILALCICAFAVQAQEKTSKYTDIILDGKPALMNMETGEVIPDSTRVTNYTVKKYEVKPDGALKQVAVSAVDSAKAVAATTKEKVVADKNTVITNTKNAVDTSKENILNQVKNNVVTDTVKTQEVANAKAKIDTPLATNTNTDALAQYNTTFAGKHIVVKGETLYSLARHYNVSVTQLCSLNAITKNTILNVGDVLRIRPAVDTPTTQVTNAPVVKTPVQATPVPVKPARVHVVEKNQTLYSISKLYNMDVTTLIRLNKLKDNAIYKGQRLLLE